MGAGVSGWGLFGWGRTVLRRGVVAGVVVGMVAVGHPGHGRTAVSPLMSGRVVVDAGKAVAGVGLWAYLEVPAGTHRINLRPLAATTTDAAGRFALAATPPDLTGARNPDGSATVVLVSAGAATVVYHVKLFPPARAGAAWTWDVADPGLVAASVPDEWGRAPRRVAASGLVVRAHRTSTTAAAEHPCGWSGQPYWRRGTASRKRWLPVQRLYTRGNARMRYEWETTHLTELEVAATYRGKAWGAGLVHSREQTYSAGMEPEVGNWKARLATVEWRFADWHMWCQDQWRPERPPWRQGLVEWRAQNWTLGNDLVVNNRPFLCNSRFRTFVASRSWVARHSSVTWKGFFEIDGARLDNRQTNSERHKLVVIPDPGVRAPVCGRDNDPAEASQVREV